MFLMKAQHVCKSMLEWLEKRRLFLGPHLVHVGCRSSRTKSTKRPESTHLISISSLENEVLIPSERDDARESNNPPDEKPVTVWQANNYPNLLNIWKYKI